MDVPLLVRIAAAVAALAVVVGPWLYAAGKAAIDWYRSRPAAPAPAPQAAGVTLADMRTVLELANRLKAVGCTDGVELCKQLLDVLLTPKVKK